jgi:hypothetical protein
MRKLLYLFIPFLYLAAAVLEAETPTTPTTKGTAMKISIRVGGTSLTATIADNPTARDFVSLLPMTLTLQDYAGREKISELPRNLSMDGAPRGIDPSKGDITYYAPWANLALFYNDFGYSSGLTLLGKIESDIEALRVGGSVRATFELIE